MGRPIEFHLGHLQIADDTGKKVRAFNEGLEKGRDDITCTERSGTIPEALLGALNSTRRQLRKARSAFRDRRKRATKAVLVEQQR